MTDRNAFDFSQAMRALCEDITQRHSAFSHIRMRDVAVTFAQARRRVSYGLQARLTPMRFEQGSTFTSKDGQQWTVQRLVVDGREMLYILTFYLPRFLDQSFHEKIVTVFHELYHISPEFDGDIRRLSGHFFVHSRSQKQYDRQMAVFADEYLRMAPPQRLFDFLGCSFRTLLRRHGAVVGLQVPIPRLIPVESRKSA